MPAEPNGEDVILATDRVTHKFGELVAVDTVTLSVPEGELRSVIGPNGAGKTTLFNVIMGVYTPTSGSVHFRGEEITQIPEYERPHRGVARSFQSNEMFESETVMENVRVVAQTARKGSFSLDLLDRGKHVATERAHEILDVVGLDDHADETATNLSHGDQRRLGVALALATDPEVLLLDEPTSGISPDRTDDVRDMIRKLNEDHGLTIVLVEHDIDVVMRISDRISVLHQGQLIKTGSPEEVRDDTDVQDAYLGSSEDIAETIEIPTRG